MIRPKKKTCRYRIELLAIFIFIFFIFVLVYLFTISKEHLYNISNYAIAISLGFASVCFSWSRAENNSEIGQSLIKAGQFFVSSIIFLIIASISDYGSFNLISQKSKNLKDIGEALKLSYFLFFGVGAVIFVLGIWEILKVLRQKE